MIRKQHPILPIIFLLLASGINALRFHCLVPDIHNAVILVQNGSEIAPFEHLPSGQTITIKCLNGGVMVNGSNYAVCRQNGHWHKISGHQITDRFGKCQNDEACPEEQKKVDHGKICGKSIKSGTLRHLVCEPGYKIFGPKYVFCINGSWTRPGVCLFVATTTTPKTRTMRPCPAMTEITNGIVSGSSVQPGSLRYISCNRGFSVVGTSLMFCAYGQWTEPGKCLPLLTSTTTTKVTQSTVSLATVAKDALQLQCPIKMLIVNGFAEDMDGNEGPGASRRVHCNKGFELIGASVVYCNANGQWSKPGVCFPHKKYKIPTARYYRRWILIN